jgi:putative aminopeptidase FrvX
MMDETRFVPLLDELLRAHAPSGQEEEVDAILRREAGPLCDETWMDPSDNFVGLLRGGKGPAVRVFAHKDELAMMVKRVEADGRLTVRELGGLQPWAIGQGMVDILGDGGTIPGVLSFSCMHTSRENAALWKAKNERPLSWDAVFVFTRRTKDELAGLGVHAGTRVVVGRQRKGISRVSDCVCAYFLDNRAAVAVGLAALRDLRERSVKPAGDVYLIGTSVEEIGGGSSAYASRTLPGDVSLAVDVGPVHKEYGTELSDQPIVAYRDGRTIYTKAVCDRLMGLGREIGLSPQTACVESYGSDASLSRTNGQTARCGLLAFPTENTHGMEIAPIGGMLNTARLLARFLEKGERD